jgi:hypothetical protein
LFKTVTSVKPYSKPDPSEKVESIVAKEASEPREKWRTSWRENGPSEALNVSKQQANKAYRRNVRDEAQAALRKQYSNVPKRLMNSFLDQVCSRGSNFGA